MDYGSLIHIVHYNKYRPLSLHSLYGSILLTHNKRTTHVVRLLFVLFVLAEVAPARVVHMHDAPHNPESDKEQSHSLARERRLLSDSIRCGSRAHNCQAAPTSGSRLPFLLPSPGSVFRFSFSFYLLFFQRRFIQ